MPAVRMLHVAGEIVRWRPRMSATTTANHEAPLAQVEAKQARQETLHQREAVQLEIDSQVEQTSCIDVEANKVSCNNKEVDAHGQVQVKTEADINIGELGSGMTILI